MLQGIHHKAKGLLDGIDHSRQEKAPVRVRARFVRKCTVRDSSLTVADSLNSLSARGVKRRLVAQSEKRQKTCSGKQRKVEMSLLSNLTARRGSILISYKRVSKAAGSHLLDLKRDTLVETGIAKDRI